MRFFFFLNYPKKDLQKLINKLHEPQNGGNKNKPSYSYVLMKKNIAK